MRGVLAFGLGFILATPLTVLALIVAFALGFLVGRLY